MVYRDIEYWASVLDESDKEKKRYEEACRRFCESKNADSSDIDEATEQFKVDDNYVKKALELLTDLASENKDAYDSAVKYLEMQKGKYLVVSPEEFAQRRIQRAQEVPATDTRSSDEIRDDAMKKAAGQWDDFEKQANTPKENPIKSIWVKDINESTVTLVIEFKNGKTTETTEDISIAEDDRYYKQIAQGIRAGRRAANDSRRVSVKDVQLSMIRIQYNSPEIKWFYGKNKVPESQWTYSEEVKKQARSKTSPISKGYLVWQSEYGSKAKIYRTI